MKPLKTWSQLQVKVLYPVSLMEFIGLSLLSLKIHSYICHRTIDGNYLSHSTLQPFYFALSTFSTSIILDIIDGP